MASVPGLARLARCVCGHSFGTKGALVVAPVNFLWPFDLGDELSTGSMAISSTGKPERKLRKRGPIAH